MSSELNETSIAVIVVGFLTMITQQAVAMYTASRNRRWDKEDRRYAADKAERAVNDLKEAVIAKQNEASAKLDTHTNDIKALVQAVGEKSSAALEVLATDVFHDYGRRLSDQQPSGVADPVEAGEERK